MIDRRRHSIILDVTLLKEAESDPDHYLLVVKVREVLAVSKSKMQMFHTLRFHFKKFHEMEGKSGIGLKSKTGSRL
jgi:hypothetical protein